MNLKEWRSIVDGQVIRGPSGVLREVVKGCNFADCITLKAIRKTKFDKRTTVYAKNDAYKFSLRREDVEIRRNRD